MNSKIPFQTSIVYWFGRGFCFRGIGYPRCRSPLFRDFLRFGVLEVGFFEAGDRRAADDHGLVVRDVPDECRDIIVREIRARRLEGEGAGFAVFEVQDDFQCFHDDYSFRCS